MHHLNSHAATAETDNAAAMYDVGLFAACIVRNNAVRSHQSVGTFIDIGDFTAEVPRTVL